MSLSLSLLDLVSLLYCYAASKTTSTTNLIYRFTSLICLLTIIQERTTANGPNYGSTFLAPRLEYQ